MAGAVLIEVLLILAGIIVIIIVGLIAKAKLEIVKPLGFVRLWRRSSGPPPDHAACPICPWPS